VRRRSFLGLLAGLLLLPARAARALCNPALVEWFGRARALVQVRPEAARRAPRLGNYFVQWFGHSSFLIQSGSATRVVTDPNLDVTPGIRADAVTVSNDHITHNNVGAVSGEPVILRGITLRQTWNPIRTSVKDITIVNLPSQRGPAWGAVANSIFIFEMGSLCLAHLGNLGHLLTPEQEKVLHHVDVLMTPIDALTNLHALRCRAPGRTLRRVRPRALSGPPAEGVPARSQPLDAPRRHRNLRPGASALAVFPGIGREEPEQPPVSRRSDLLREVLML
jgi:hypothetical protein